MRKDTYRSLSPRPPMYACPPALSMIAANESIFAIDGCADIVTTMFDTSTNLSYTRTITYIIVPKLGDSILIGRDAMLNVIALLDVNKSLAIFDESAEPDSLSLTHLYNSPLTAARGTVIPPGQSAVMQISYDPSLDTAAQGYDILYEPTNLYNKRKDLIMLDFTPQVVSAQTGNYKPSRSIIVRNTGDSVLSIPMFTTIGHASHVQLPEAPAAAQHPPAGPIDGPDTSRRDAYEHRHAQRRRKLFRHFIKNKEEMVDLMSTENFNPHQKSSLHMCYSTSDPQVSLKLSAHLRFKEQQRNQTDEWLDQQAQLLDRTEWYTKGFGDGFVKKHDTVENSSKVRMVSIMADDIQNAYSKGWTDGASISPELQAEFFKEFDANKKLTAEQIDQLKSMLLRNRDVFDKIKIGDPAPRAVGVDFSIHTGDAVPLKQAPYRHSPANEAAIQKEVDQLLSHGLIEPSFSPWASPVLLVKKKDGSQRMCIDYRKLNSVSKKDAYPLPLIEDCLERCKNAKWMTIIDLADAYHHIPMAANSEAATAFVTRTGLYHWKVMPYGATGCPGAFQRYVDKVLFGLIGEICTAYFDDIVIYTDGTYEQHLIDVERVLVRLREHNLRAKIKKCHFAMEEIIFVGHQVKNGTIKPDPDKLRAIQEIPIPNDVTQLKSFLGLVNYYRKFIPGFAKIALPLYALTKKGVEYTWSGITDAAFNQLKAALISADCLYAPDFKKQFILQTDACKTGIGSVLTQNFDGEEHPVAYISRQLLPAEKNYSATEQEALAVVWGIKTFEHYLVDKPFIVVTDHHALQWMPTKKSLNKRLTRWALFLSEFSFEVQYRKGKDNANADGLSRNPIPAKDADSMVDIPDQLPIRCTHVPERVNAIFKIAEDHNKEEFIYIKSTTSPITTSASVIPHRIHPSRTQLVMQIKSTASAEAKKKVEDEQDDFIVVEQNVKSIVEAQRKDPKLHDLIRYLENKEIPATYNQLARTALLRKASRYIIDAESKALYCIRQPDSPVRAAFMPFQRRLVIPEQYRQQIMEVYHDAPFGGHLGISKTYRRIALRYEWEGMYQDIASHVIHCAVCARSKAVTHLPERQHPRMRSPNSPFEIVAMDHIGPLVESQDFKYILVVVCMFTGWAITIPVMDTSAVVTTRVFLDYVICQHGCPRRILTDNAFNNETTRDFLQTFHMKHILISPNHPQTNGMVERLNGTLKKILRTLGQAYLTDWTRYLQACTFVYNTSPKERDGLSPFFALYGREAHLPGELFRGMDDFDYGANQITEHVRETRSRLKDVHNYMRQRLDQIALKNVEQQQKLASYPIHNIGDQVWLRENRAHTSKPTLFARRYDGPFVVRSRIGQVNYDISRPDRPGHTQLVHVDDIKKAHTQSKFSHESSIMPPTPIVQVAEDNMDVDNQSTQALSEAASSMPSLESSSSHLNRRERQEILRSQVPTAVTNPMNDVTPVPSHESPLPVAKKQLQPEEPSQHPMSTRARQAGLRVNMNERAQEQLALMNEYSLYKPTPVGSKHPSQFTSSMIQIVKTASAALRRR